MTRRSSLRWATLTFAAVVLWYFWPALSGSEVFFFRDLGTTHFPAAALARSLGLTQINPYASFGQPYAGNPNLTIVIRYLLAFLNPTQQLLLQWMAMLAGTFVFLKTMGMSREAAFFGAITFCCSGYTLSSESFLNTSTSLAAAPWFLWCAVRTQRLTWRAVTVDTVVWAVLLVTGEPVVIALTAVIGCALAAGNGARSCLRFLACGLIAATIEFPLHWRTLSAAMDSARVLRGYTSQQGLSQSMHLLRLPEVFIRGLYGLPGSLVGGGWWGFRVSDGASPYLYSIALNVTCIVAVIALAIATRCRQDRLWWMLALIGITLSFGVHLPGAATIYDHVSFLHAFRYPIRFWFLPSVAMAILGARALDYWRSTASEGQRRGIASVIVTGAGLCGAAAVFAWVARSVVFSWLLTLGWDSRWHAPAELALAPIINSITLRLAFASLSLMVFAMSLRSAGRMWMTILLCLTAADGAIAAAQLMPTVRVAALPAGRFTEAVAAIPGRVFERAGKDLEPIRMGVFGRYDSDATSNLAVAQARQAWSLGGATHGVRYAYDRSPDGSYTLRNQLVQDRLDATMDWRLRLKWLRAAGVVGVITPNLPNGFPGLHTVATEETVGIPETLFRIMPTLAEVRRVGGVVWASSPDDAIAKFEASEFDERTTVVLEGPGLSTNVSSGVASLILDAPGELQVRTTGPSQGVLFIARTYRGQTRAWFNGRPVTIYPANVHLIGMILPAGNGVVRVSL